MIARWFGLAWRVAAAGVFVYLTTALLFAFFACEFLLLHCLSSPGSLLIPFY